MALRNYGQLECFVAERALESLNGDAVFIEEEAGELFIIILDGAGHGEGAYKIARIGIKYIQENNKLKLPALMSGLHKELKGTHGAVAIIGRLNLITKDLYYVSMGNIFLRVFGTKSKREVTQGGVIGYQIRTPKEKHILIKSEDIVIFHTDGISSRFNETDYENIIWDDSETIANTLLDRFGKDNDDATCVVMRFSDKD